MATGKLGASGWPRAVGKLGIGALGAALLLLLIGLAVSYERQHISADLRRTLLIALAPDAPDSLVQASLPLAKAHVRTWRDREEYAKLQAAVKLTVAARGRQVQLDGRLKQEQAELDAEIHSERLMIVTERAYLNSHQAMPAGLADDVIGEQQRRERVRDQQRRAEESAWLELLQQRLDARVMLQELRVDLGMARAVAQP